jgi:hypothetical protein
VEVLLVVEPMLVFMVQVAAVLVDTEQQPHFQYQFHPTQLQLELVAQV